MYVGMYVYFNYQEWFQDGLVSNGKFSHGEWAVAKSKVLGDFNPLVHLYTSLDFLEYIIHAFTNLLLNLFLI